MKYLILILFILNFGGVYPEGKFKEWQSLTIKFQEEAYKKNADYSIASGCFVGDFRKDKNAYEYTCKISKLEPGKNRMLHRYNLWLFNGKHPSSSLLFPNPKDLFLKRLKNDH